MFRLRISLLLLMCCWTLSYVYGLEGYKIYEVTPTTRAQCDLLYVRSQQEQLYDFFSLSKLPHKPARVMVHPEEVLNFQEFLALHNMPYRILSENISESIARAWQYVARNSTLYRTTGQGRLSTERYYTHDEINAYIDDLAKRYPSRAFVKQVGKSFQGRIMKTITITNGDGRGNKNVVFMDGGFHAREWISPAAVLYIIEQLVENFSENAELLQDYDWVVLPVVNPDGYEHTQTSTTARIFRKTRQPYKFLGQTCYGADPNRNFDFHWGEEGASSNPCIETYAGPKAFSEPETVVVRDIMYTLKGRGIMYLTIHSYGQYLLYPWGWTSDLPDTWRDMDEVARAGADAIYEATGTVYTVGSSTNVLYIAAGASDDYAFYAGFPIPLTMELPAGGITGFDPPTSSIDRIVKETWIGVRAMANKVVQKYPL